MQFNQEIIVHGIKESKGSIEGRTYDSTVFHVEADLKANASGRAVGKSTTPMNCGTSEEFAKWMHLEKHFPIRAIGSFEIQSNGKGETSLQLLAIRPIEKAAAAATAK